MSEIRDIVATIRRGLVGTDSADEIASITAALTHLCYMTENLAHHADVSPLVLKDVVVSIIHLRMCVNWPEAVPNTIFHVM